jgi:two-component system sensor histidine kinase DesK
MSEPQTATPDAESCTPSVRFGNRGWQRFVFPSVWLVYLGQTASGVHEHSSGAVAVAGYVIVALFAACYLLALQNGWQSLGLRFAWLFAVSIALTVAECFIAREDAFVFCVYLAVLTVGTRTRWAPFGIIVLTASAAFGPRFLPGMDGKVGWQSGLSVLLVAFAMWGFFHIIHANSELAAARAEVARLAAENERSRIARDLHDLLGHSLTTITVKAGLARRLGERGETAKSLTEIGEVEQLARRTLGDVRAAVAGHREVTLAGELATAREVLRATGVVAELPGSVDVVDAELSEVFGWVVREGVTNVVRHARAGHCKITLGERWVEISDDGRGGIGGAGNGISGLRERLTAVGGTLLATGSTFGGFRLRAEVPVGASAGEPVEVVEAAGAS